VVTSSPVISAGKKSIMEAEPEETALDEMEGETGDGNCFVSGGCTLHLSSLGPTIGGLAVTCSILGIRRERPKSASVTTRSGRRYKLVSTSQVMKRGPSLAAWQFQNAVNLSQAKGSGCSSLLMSLSCRMVS